MERLQVVDRLGIIAMVATAAAISFAMPAFSAEVCAAARLSMPDGIERLFCTSGPLGVTTFRVDVSRDGGVLARTQVLTDDVFRSIVPGMSAEGVLELIGPPANKVRFEATRSTAWDYHYRDAWGYLADFSVIVDDSGKVAGKFSARSGN